MSSLKTVWIRSLRDIVTFGTKRRQRSIFKKLFISSPLEMGACMRVAKNECQQIRLEPRVCNYPATRDGINSYILIRHLLAAVCGQANTPIPHHLYVTCLCFTGHKNGFLKYNIDKNIFSCTQMIYMSIKKILRLGKAKVRNDLSELLHFFESQPSQLDVEIFLQALCIHLATHLPWFVERIKQVLQVKALCKT